MFLLLPPWCKWIPWLYFVLYWALLLFLLLSFLAPLLLFTIWYLFLLSPMIFFRSDTSGGPASTLEVIKTSYVLCADVCARLLPFRLHIQVRSTRKYMHLLTTRATKGWIETESKRVGITEMCNSHFVTWCKDASIQNLDYKNVFLSFCVHTSFVPLKLHVRPHGHPRHRYRARSLLLRSVVSGWLATRTSTFYRLNVSFYLSANIQMEGNRVLTAPAHRETSLTDAALRDVRGACVAARFSVD